MKSWRTKSGYKIIRIIYGRSNVFLLTNGEKNILIDTSPAKAWKLLERKLNTLGIEVIDYLILTHSHYDHSDNAIRIKEKYKARIIIHKDEAVALSLGKAIIPKGTMIFSRIIVLLANILYSKYLQVVRCQPDLMVDEKYDLKKDGFNAYILHTPGHTKGSVSLIIDDEIAVVGDTMFGVLRGSVFPPFADDTDQMIKSWGKLLETGCSLFLPSHGTENKRSLVRREYDKRIKRSKG